MCVHTMGEPVADAEVHRSGVCPEPPFLPPKPAPPEPKAFDDLPAPAKPDAPPLLPGNPWDDEKK